MVGERVEVDAHVKRAAEAALGRAEGGVGGLGFDGPELAPHGRDVGALLGREHDAAAAFDEGREIDERQLGDWFRGP